MLTEDIKEKILAHSNELFSQYGIRSVTMDDVAKGLSMSKKTLYQYFDNKDDLITETVHHRVKKETDIFRNIGTRAKNAVHEVILMSHCVRDIMRRTNPALLFDLQKYHNRAWEIYLDFKNNSIKGNVCRVLESGKKDGLFRESMDVEILSILRVEQTQLPFNSSIYPFDKFNFKDVQLQIFDHFIHGILTDKGREIYNQYSQLETQTQITN